MSGYVPISGYSPTIGGIPHTSGIPILWRCLGLHWVQGRVGSAQILVFPPHAPMGSPHWKYLPNGESPWGSKYTRQWGLPIHVQTSHLWEDFPYMGSLPAYGEASHVWEDFSYVGRLPAYGNSSHKWEVFPSHIWESFPYMGSLPIYGKSSQHVGELPMCGTPSHIREVFPYMGRLPMYGKSSHVWEVFPFMGSKRPATLHTMQSQAPPVLGVYP
jgi:hypothetical protein